MLSSRSDNVHRLGRLFRLRRVMRLIVILNTIRLVEENERQRRLVPKRRSKLIKRERRPWEPYIEPMLEDNTFKGRFRMGYGYFDVLVRLLGVKLVRDAKMGSLRNGAIPVEFQVALTLRWLAGASMYEGMDGHIIAKSTAYQTAYRVIHAINECPGLDCKWPNNDDEMAKAARAFRERSSHGVIDKCVGALDGLFIRMIRPTRKEDVEPNKYYSSHKKSFGMNFQDNRVDHESPVSQNDRTAYKFSAIDKVLHRLSPGYFIGGDAAYPASDRVLVPYPGKNLPASQDAYNFFQSQCRMSVEETFGIMVRTWAILWRPMEVRQPRFAYIVNSIVRRHNFCRNRNVEVPARDDGEVSLPADISFSEDGRISGDYFKATQRRSGRPANDQTGLSGPRESIRSKLEVEGIVRPAHNLARNSRG